MIELRAQQGDTLDLICRRVYGQETAENVAAALDLNPGLADLGVVLPTGTRVRLPDPPTATPTVAVVKLWD
ncbi:tail protein X [Roseospira visakhapatnamensis]|uniref:Phage tail protein X n=1 Tax=Roseospira visakhapatnamensis TaxID=390880 RepID=A0A7W6REL2_9PROT|nr:tail protein X [Roseospira visakhapatnamensis]MBB4266877.1 phage tail protein X [Roseospira visakhapatnamensis]